MVSGIILGGFGIGALIFGFISTALVNPENAKPIKYANGSFYSKDISDRVSYNFDFNKLYLGTRNVKSDMFDMGYTLCNWSYIH
jgi:hypothetical protein